MVAKSLATGIPTKSAQNWYKNDLNLISNTKSNIVCMQGCNQLRILSLCVQYDGFDEQVGNAIFY